MPRPIDTLCCGRPGRVDFLLECGHRLNDVVLTEAAHTMTCPMLPLLRSRRAELRPDRRLRVDCGLWHGSAGAGYALLRLSDPTMFPSILLFA
ncbi:MAG: lanthionine synthetase LanC family protein [Candidatus Binatia bacterium]